MQTFTDSRALAKEKDVNNLLDKILLLNRPVKRKQALLENNPSAPVLTSREIAGRMEMKKRLFQMQPLFPNFIFIPMPDKTHLLSD